MGLPTTKTTEAAASTDPSSRKIPHIRPEDVHLDHSGLVTQRWFVRLPAGMIADNLKEPGIWTKAKLVHRAMRKHDELVMLEYDEAWRAEAVIGAASDLELTLNGLKVIQLESRQVPLFSDGKYRIKWAGNGYVVERLADSRIMSNPVANVALAERDLRSLYPRPA